MRSIAGFIKLAVLGAVLISGSAHASMQVGDYGETGWQTRDYTFTQNFTGSVLLGVTNYGDTVSDAVALFDNLIGFGPSTNTSFESGNLNGYVTNGTASVVGASSSYSGNGYLASDGTLFAQLVSNNASTAWIGGTNGAWLEVLDVSAAAGDKISFDWAFLAKDFAPFADFVFFGLRDSNGNVFYSERLASISAVPIPAGIWLFGSGLAGLFAVAMKRNITRIQGGFPMRTFT